MLTFFPLNHFFGDSHFSWNINGGVVLLYIVLMIIIPEAKSVKQKLEMMGEEEYIKSIRERVSDNLASSKSRSEEGASTVSSNMQAEEQQHAGRTSEVNLDEMPPEL